MKSFKQFIKEQKIFGLVPHNVGSWYHDYGDAWGSNHVSEHPIEHTLGNEDKSEFFNNFPGNKEYIENMAKNFASGENKPPPVAGTPHPENPKFMSVIDGNHRLHAAKKAGIDKIPVEHIPHEDVRLLHPDYKIHEDPKDPNHADEEMTISQGTPLTDFKEKDGSYNMDRKRKRLGGLSLRHYFRNTDGSFHK